LQLRFSLGAAIIRARSFAFVLFFVVLLTHIVYHKTPLSATCPAKNILQKRDAENAARPGGAA
jgi:hypothetical protein